MTRERGLYRNGRLWWCRVRSPISYQTKPRSTGTEDLKLANRVIQMVDTLSESRPQWDLLDLAAAGDLPLLTLYNHFAAGTLHELREKKRTAAVNDPDVAPWVERWWREHLAVRVTNNQISEETANDYLRQVRYFIPDDGERFPRSKFSEDHLKAQLLALPFSGSTRRRYLAALRLFYRYARKRVPLVENPFEDADWLPENNPSRLVWWDHETRVKVIEAVEGSEFRAALSLMLGSGIELGALVAMTRRHVAADTVTAPGTKNEARRNRTIFVDAWARPALHEQFVPFATSEPLFPNIDEDGGNLRDAFYEAQVKCGLIAEPPRAEKTGKKLWKQVNPHTLHDCRHTYVVCRSLGLDGEPEQNAKFCAHQLGHANEQMVLQIYGKVNLDELRRRRAAREGK